MGLFFKKKGWKSGNKLTEEDRQRSLETRKANAEIRKIENETKKAELNYRKVEAEAELIELKKRLYPPDEEEEDNNSIDNIIIKQVAPYIPDIIASFTGKKLPAAIESTQSMNLTDEQILEFIAKVPKKYLKLSKGMSDDNLKIIIQNQMPLLDDDSIGRAIGLIKEKS